MQEWIRKFAILSGAITFLLAPLFVFGQEISTTLKEKQVIDLLSIIRKYPLTDAQRDLYDQSLYYPDSDFPVKTGAVMLTKQVILQSELDYWFVKMPVEFSKRFIKAVYKLLPLVAYGDFSGAIDLIEKFTVEQANQYIDNWLKQNQVLIGSGIGKYAFVSFKNNPQAINIPYIIVYSPVSQNKAKVVIEFYLKTAIEPPESRGSAESNMDWVTKTSWPKDRWLLNEKKGNNDGKIEPFIVRVKGQVVKDQFGNFAWDKLVAAPSVEVEFGKPVPEIDQSDIILQNLEQEQSQGFLQKKINQIKQTAQGIINQIKAFLAIFKPQAQIASFIESPVSSGGQPSAKLEEGSPPLLPLIQEAETVKVKDPLTGLVDQFDDIAEKSEILFSQAEQFVNEQNASAVEEATEKMRLAVEQAIEEKQEDLAFKQGTTSISLTIQPIICSQTAYQTQEPSFDKVIFNEIAWMGSKNSSSDEWIELKNISVKSIDLNGWQIFNKSQGIKIIIATSSVVAPGGFWLLERTDDNSAPLVKADLIYTGAIANSDEALYLVGPNCILQDKAQAKPYWQEGDNTTKETMERNQFFGWQTSSVVGGTPKAKNSAGKIKLLSATGGAGVTAYSPPRPPDPSSLPKLLINEIQIESEQGVSDEFIELYNPNSEDVSLKWWSIQKAASSGAISKKNFGTEDIIPAKGYFLIVNSYASQQLLSLADMTHNSFSIASANTIFLVKNQDYIVSGKESAISDKTGWGESFFPEGMPAPQPQTGQTIGRKWLGQSNEYQDTDNNQEDFEIQTPTPKTRNQPLPENQPPIALFSFSPENLEVGQEIVFSAASSTDPDGFITSFTWDFGDDATFSSEKPTVSHSFTTSSQFQITLFVKDNKGATSSPLIHIIAVLPKPKILISEIQIESTEYADDEFIELFNPNESAILLEDWSIQKATPSGAISKKNFRPGDSIPAKGYFLIVNSHANQLLLDSAGMAHSSFSIASGNTIFLAENHEYIVSGKEESIKDKVGFGMNRVTLGVPFSPETDFAIAPAEKSGKSLGRKLVTTTEQYQDTNNNQADFEIQKPTPKAKNEKDLTQPETEIVLKPPCLTNQAQAIFSFSSNEQDSAFQCKLDSQDWQDCSSSITYANLPDGLHLFQVKAIDPVGNEDQSPAQHSWAIDTTIESPFLALADSSNGSAFYTNKQTVAVNIFQDQEAWAWFLSENSEKPGLETIGWTETKPQSFFLSENDPLLIAGKAKTVYVWVKDKADNVSPLGNSASIILDTISPQTEIEQGPANPTNQTQAAFSFSSSEQDSVFQCKLDSQDWLTCSSSVAYTGIVEGSHLFYARAIDKAGNYSLASSSYSWLVDITFPISQVEPLATSSATTAFTVKWFGSDTSSGILNYDVQYKEGAEGEWQDLVQATASQQVEFLGQDEHTYYFRSRAKDIAGNIENWSEEPDAFIKIETPKDKTAPSAITDFLAQTGTEPREIILSWTAPGDNGNIGQASAYIIKYFSEKITEDNWVSSTLVAGLPTPKQAGSQETYVVSGLAPATTYYFAIKSKDQANNTSTISNSPGAKTLNQLPISYFSYLPDENIMNGDEITFNASSSFDPDGEIAFYSWDFNDGTFATTGQPIISHTFVSSGQFLVWLVVIDEQGATSAPATANIEVAEKPKPKLLISEVQIIDSQSTAHDFVEIFNPTDIDIELGNCNDGYLKLAKRTNTGIENQSIKSWRNDSEAKITAKGYYLWARSEDEDYPSSINADAWTKQSISSDNGAALIFVRNGEEFVIDAVGWGNFSNLLFESTAFPENPKENQSLGRKWSTATQEYQDTDNNQEDFELQTPTPKVKNEKGNFLAPESVKNFRVANSTGNTVVLIWSTSTDSDTPQEQISYIVYYSKQPLNEQTATSSNLLAQTATTSATTLTIENLQLDSFYYFGARAFDGFFYSALSATATFATALSPIANLMAIPSTVRGAVDLFWTCPTSATAYIIKKSEQEISTTTWDTAQIISQSILPKPAGGIEFLQAEGLDANKKYYFAVKYVGLSGVTSTISNVAFATAWQGFLDNGNGTLTDLRTNLMWPKDSQSQINNLGATTTQPGAINFISQQNSTSSTWFAGQSDWRVGNFKELASLFDYKTGSMAGNNSFQNIIPDKYWSKSQWLTYSPGFPGDEPRFDGWFFNFQNGEVGSENYSGNNSSQYPFLACRGTEIPGGMANDNFDFTDNGDGTISDIRTGLMWLKASFALADDSERKTWKNAFNFANNAVLCNDKTLQGSESAVGDCSANAGVKYDNFRLPNVQEMLEITKMGPSLVLPWQGGFSYYYWTATMFDENNFWQVGDGTLLGKISVKNKNSQLNVQLVREP